MAEELNVEQIIRLRRLERALIALLTHEIEGKLVVDWIDEGHPRLANEVGQLVSGLKPRPKHPMNKDYLQLAGDAINEKLPDNHGFILLVAGYGEPSKRDRCNYIATMNRKDAVNMLKEFLIQACGQKDTWLKHIE